MITNIEKVATRLFSLGMSVEQIAQITELKKVEISKLVKRI